jgi:ribose 5-phosphate isomerase B
MKIALGADHRGFALKNFFLSHAALGGTPITWIDYGTFSPERTDYPQFAKEVAAAVQNHGADAGILACGSGTGMAVTANRFKGVFAAVVWCPAIACVSKEDDNVNILVFPADFITHAEALEIVTRWLSCRFKQDHYAERLAMIDEEVK